MCRLEKGGTWQFRERVGEREGVYQVHRGEMPTSRGRDSVPITWRGGERVRSLTTPYEPSPAVSLNCGVVREMIADGLTAAPPPPTPACPARRETLGSEPTWGHSPATPLHLFRPLSRDAIGEHKLIVRRSAGSKQSAARHTQTSHHPMPRPHADQFPKITPGPSSRPQGSPSLRHLR